MLSKRLFLIYIFSFLTSTNCLAQQYIDEQKDSTIYPSYAIKLEVLNAILGSNEFLISFEAKPFSFLGVNLELGKVYYENTLNDKPEINNLSSKQLGIDVRYYFYNDAENYSIFYNINYKRRFTEIDQKGVYGG